MSKYVAGFGDNVLPDPETLKSQGYPWIGYPGYPIDAANAYSDFQTLSTYMEKQTLSTFMENQKYINGKSNPKYSGQDSAISRI